MPIPRFRIRTLMIAVAAVGLYLAGLMCGPPWMVVSLALLTLFVPLTLVLVYLVRKVGRNTLI